MPETSVVKSIYGDNIFREIACYPQPYSIECAERLRDLRELGITEFYYYGETLIGRFRVLGKGHAGIWVKAMNNGKYVLVIPANFRKAYPILKSIYKIGFKNIEEFTYLKKPEIKNPIYDFSDSRVKIAMFPGGGENPGTYMPTKRWPIEKFIKLIKILNKTNRICLFILLYLVDNNAR